jgi:hypothetical protein
MSKVYVHSVHRDFQQTQVLPEPAYLGRCVRPGKMMFLDCGCDHQKWLRVRRLLWMRLVPSFRFYHCLHCGARVFRPRIRQRGLYSTVYMPPRSIDPRGGFTVSHGSVGRPSAASR